MVNKVFNQVSSVKNNNKNNLQNANKSIVSLPAYWITPRLLTQFDGGASSDKSFSNIVKNVSPFISTVRLCDNVMQLIYPFAKGKCYRKKIIKSDGLLAYQCIKQ